MKKRLVLILSCWNIGMVLSIAIPEPDLLEVAIERPIMQRTALLICRQEQNNRAAITIPILLRTGMSKRQILQIITAEAQKETNAAPARVIFPHNKEFANFPEELTNDYLKVDRPFVFRVFY